MAVTRGLLAGLAVAALLTPLPAGAFRYVALGRQAPVLALSDAEGRAVSFPRAGRPAVILFWRPGQRFSEDALEDLAELARQFGPKGVDIVAVAEAGADHAQGRARAQTLPLSFLLDRDGRAGEAYGVIVYPSTAVIGTDGRLRYYLPSRNPSYRALVESHVLRARGEISEQALVARATRAGATYGGVAERAQAAYGRGVTLVREKRYAEASAALAEALRLAPDLPDAHLQLGYAKLELGEPAHALKEFEFVLQKSPASPAARAAIGIARLRLGEIDEGIRLLEDAVILNPEPVRAHYELARAYEARGDPTRAIEHYRWAYLKLLQGRK